MAALKIAQIRSTLDAFATLYGKAGASDKADAIRALSSALAPADKLSVDDVVQALEKNKTKSPSHSTGEH